MAGKRRRWGRVRQLPSGRWQARYPGPDATLHPAPDTFPTKTDAELWLVDKEAEIRRYGWHDPYAGRVRLGDYARDWLAGRKSDIAPTTYDKYEVFLRLHLAPFLGAFELADLSTERVRRWRAERLAALAPKGGPTVAGSYRLLRAILNTAVEDERIRSNPCRIKGADRDDSPERPTVAITDVFAIADAIRPERWRCMVLLAAFTSLRFGELIALRRRDVDLGEGLIVVRRKVGEAGGKQYLGAPKTRAGRRTVAIPAALGPELVHHLDEWAEQGPNGRVFLGARGATPRRSDFNKLWHAAVEAAGVDVDPDLGLHLHDLRHTGNDLRSPGASLRDLMTHMGHSTQHAALVYQHADTERQKAMAALVSAAIEQAKGHVAGTPADRDTGDDDAASEPQPS